MHPMFGPLAGGLTPLELPCIQCAGHQRAAEGRWGTLVWWIAKRQPLFDYSGGHVSGGHPKAAIDHAALRRAAEGRPRQQFADFCACIPKVSVPSKQFGHRFPQQLNRGHSYSDSVWPAFGGPYFLVHIYMGFNSLTKLCL